MVEGKVAVIDCLASGEPQPLITWQRNGIRVETDLRYFVEDKVLGGIGMRQGLELDNLEYLKVPRKSLHFRFLGDPRGLSRHIPTGCPLSTLGT